MSRRSQKFAVVLALAVLALSARPMHALDDPTPPPPTIVTGGDPQPIGPAATMLGTLLPIVIAIVTK